MEDYRNNNVFNHHGTHQQSGGENKENFHFAFRKWPGAALDLKQMAHQQNLNNGMIGVEPLGVGTPNLIPPPSEAQNDLYRQMVEEAYSNARPPQGHSERIDPKKQICFDFTKGTCARGGACKYSHDIDLIVRVNSQERGICFDYLRQQCQRGRLCRFSHDISNIAAQQCQWNKAGKRNAPICYDFVKGQCLRGANCRYSHDINSIINSTRTGPAAGPTSGEICYDYTRGRCARGGSCKYSHDPTKSFGFNYLMASRLAEFANPGGPAVTQYQLAQVAAAIHARQRGASDPGESGQGAGFGSLATPNETYNMPNVQNMYTMEGMAGSVAQPANSGVQPHMSFTPQTAGGSASALPMPPNTSRRHTHDGSTRDHMYNQVLEQMQLLGFNHSGAHPSNTGQWQEASLPSTGTPGSVPYASAMPQPACVPYGMQGGADVGPPASAAPHEGDAPVVPPAPAVELIQHMSLERVAQLQHMLACRTAELQSSCYGPGQGQTAEADPGAQWAGQSHQVPPMHMRGPSRTTSGCPGTAGPDSSSAEEFSSSDSGAAMNPCEGDAAAGAICDFRMTLVKKIWDQ